MPASRVYKYSGPGHHNTCVNKCEGCAAVDEAGAIFFFCLYVQIICINNIRDPEREAASCRWRTIYKLNKWCGLSFFTNYIALDKILPQS